MTNVYATFLFIFTCFFTTSIWAIPKLKFASIFPKGTVFSKPYEKMSRKLKKKIDIKIFPGGRAGNERKILSRLRKGSIDMAFLTAVALGQVAPRVKIVELPYFFKSYKQKYKVVKKLYPDFQKDFDKKGFVLAGWGDLGDIHLFSNVPVSKLNDFKKIKLWAPKGEPLAKAMYQEWGFVPHYSTIDGLRGKLASKKIDAFLGPSSGAIGLGWFRHAKYVTFPRITIYSGGLLIAKRSFDKLNEGEQKALLKACARATKEMSKRVRRANKTSWKVLKQRGYTFVNASKEMDSNLRKNSKKVAKKLIKMGLYSNKFLKRVKKMRKAAR